MSLNKRRIGELYDLPIVTGDLNMVNNHELLLEMNDDNTPKALKQRVNGDLFKTILGEGSGSNTNPGYNVTKQTVTLFNDTIETQGQVGMYQGGVDNIDFDLIAGETYTVVFDGTSYDVKATTFNEQILLGEGDSKGPSFETYPFAILYGIDNIDNEEIKVITLFTNIEGSHTVIIKHEEETVTPTPEFKSAVDSVTGYSIDKESETICVENEIQATQGSSYQFNSSFNLVIGDSYKVIFDGTEYQCVCYEDGDSTNAIGEVFNSGYHWDEYPFQIAEQYGTAMGNFQTGTHDIKIEHLTASTKTTPAFESMIQGIAGGSTSGCQIIYPDDIVWSSSLYSIYNNPPEQGKIYFIPFADTGSTNGKYLYPVYINELTNADNQFSGSATIIGTPIIVNNGTLTVLDFDGVINPSSLDTSGLRIVYSHNAYRLSYAKRASH